MTVGRVSSHVAHKLPGDAGCVSCTETLPSRSKGTSCAFLHMVSHPHQPAGGSAFKSPIQELLPLRPAYIPGHLNQGADILSRPGLRPG